MFYIKMLNKGELSLKELILVKLKRYRVIKENEMHIIELLDLKKITAVHGRAEEAGRTAMYREQFDLCVSRAVARLPVLCELCLPFVQVGGLFCAMKGMQTEEEVKESLRAIPMLGGKLLDVREIKIDLDFASTLSFDDDELAKIREFSSASRYVVLIEKKKKTLDIYPRTWAQMTKKTL